MAHKLSTIYRINLASFLFETWKFILLHLLSFKKSFFFRNFESRIWVRNWLFTLNVEYIRGGLCLKLSFNGPIVQLDSVLRKPLHHLPIHPIKLTNSFSLLHSDPVSNHIRIAGIAIKKSDIFITSIFWFFFHNFSSSINFWIEL